MRNIKIIVLILLVISCKSSSDKDTHTFKLSSSLKDGELSLTVNDRMQLLKEEGNIVKFHTSEDKKNILLEVQMLSTLSILKLYKWNLSSEEYVEDSININRLAWQIFEKKHSIGAEELESSHVYFLEWKGEDSIVVELRGNRGMGEFISDTVALRYSPGGLK